MMWYDAASLTIEGRGWSDTEEFYHRLPARSKDNVPESVWTLSTNTAGMVVRFVTDSASIDVRWTLSCETLAMNHMPATGVSSLDLYVRRDEKWRWLAIGIPTGMENEATLVSELPPAHREYALYLPLYNGVKSLEIGLADGAHLEIAPPRKRGPKPVVFYGSSITQGGCVSRPGMAYPSIIGRSLDAPIINLGFSGSGRCEKEVADLLTELEPSLYVIDCMPNMEACDVDERLRYLMSQLRNKCIVAPVVLVENLIYQNEFIHCGKEPSTAPKNRILGKIFADLAPVWNGMLHYVVCEDLLGADGEATVDAVHPTDLGHMRMAEVLTPAIEQALDKT